MATVVGYTADGKPIHRLNEQTPLRFWTPRSAPTPRRVRESLRGIGDRGVDIMTTSNTGGRTTMHDRTHVLADFDVPIVGRDTAWIGDAQIGVEVGPAPHRLRESGAAADSARFLEAEGVPVRKPSSKPFGLRGNEDEGEGEDESSELYMSGEGEDEDEGGEEEDEGAEVDDDDLAQFCHEVGEFAHDAAKGLGLVAAALRRRRRAGHAAAGMLD